MTIVRNGASIVRKRLRQTQGLTATIARGLSTCSAVIVLGQSNNSAMDRSNMKFEVDCQDFFVQASDYAPGGTAVEPAADDTITVTIGGRVCTFEVRPADDNKQVFTSDRNNSEYRVHTKFVEKI